MRVSAIVRGRPDRTVFGKEDAETKKRSPVVMEPSREVEVLHRCELGRHGALKSTPRAACSSQVAHAIEKRLHDQQRVKYQKRKITDETVKHERAGRGNEEAIPETEQLVAFRKLQTPTRVSHGRQASVDADDRPSVNGQDKDKRAPRLLPEHCGQAARSSRCDERCRSSRGMFVTIEMSCSRWTHRSRSRSHLRSDGTIVASNSSTLIGTQTTSLMPRCYGGMRHAAIGSHPAAPPAGCPSGSRPGACCGGRCRGASGGAGGGRRGAADGGACGGTCRRVGRELRRLRASAASSGR